MVASKVFHYLSGGLGNFPKSWNRWGLVEEQKADAQFLMALEWMVAIFVTQVSFLSNYVDL